VYLDYLFVLFRAIITLACCALMMIIIFQTLRDSAAPDVNIFVVLVLSNPRIDCAILFISSLTVALFF